MPQLPPPHLSVLSLSKLVASMAGTGGALFSRPTPDAVLDFGKRLLRAQPVIPLTPTLLGLRTSRLSGCPG